MRIQGEAFGIDSQTKTFRVAHDEHLGGLLGPGRRIVVYFADADPVAEEREALEFEVNAIAALQGGDPCHVLFHMSGGRWRCAWEGPGSGNIHLDNPEATQLAAARRLRASLEPEEQPCPHEGARWMNEERDGEIVSKEGWWGSRDEGYPFFGNAGEICPLCGKPLPQKPVEEMSVEEQVREVLLSGDWPTIANGPQGGVCLYLETRGRRHRRGEGVTFEEALESYVRKIRSDREEASSDA